VAAFGEGEALEQLGRLQDAATRFEELLGSHPNREAVQIKLDAVIVRLRRREQDGTQVMDRGMLLNPGSGGDAEKDPPKTQGAQTHEE